MKIHSINTYIEPKPMNNSLPNFKGKLLSQKIINPQKHLMQDAFIQLFNKIKSKGNKIIQIPSVSIPLVSYMGINKNKVLYEMDKSYQPYTNKVYETKEEFIKRGLPFKEEYVSDYTGGLSLTGENIIKNYDKSKALFEQEGLYFSNDLIDVHTGNLNYNGISIQNTYLRTCEKLKKAGQPIKDCYYDHKTGALSKEGLQVTQNSVSFGSSTDDQQFDPADTSYSGETYGDIPQVYEPETGIQGFSQHAGVTNFNDAISGTPISASLAEVADMLDNPVLTGIAAELLPGTKFLKPAKDLWSTELKRAA